MRNKPFPPIIVVCEKDDALIEQIIFSTVIIGIRDFFTIIILNFPALNVFLKDSELD